MKRFLAYQISPKARTMVETWVWLLLHTIQLVLSLIEKKRNKKISHSSAKQIEGELKKPLNR